MKFSKWKKFDHRDELENIDYPGIYAIAISSRNLEDSAFEYIKLITYFGMTNAKNGLRGRLSAFNNTLRDKSGPGPGGAERFLYDYPDPDGLAKKLYVSVCPFKCNVESILRKDLETMGSVAKAEFVAFANYAELFGRLPKYNDKKNSPKKRG